MVNKENSIILDCDNKSPLSEDLIVAEIYCSHFCKQGGPNQGLVIDFLKLVPAAQNGTSMVE